MDKPIVTPLAELFSSRKFILAVATIVLNVLVRAVPELAKYADQLSLIITVSLGLLFFHLSAEDLIKLSKEPPASEQTAGTDVVAEFARIATELLAGQPKLPEPKVDAKTVPLPEKTTVLVDAGTTSDGRPFIGTSAVPESIANG